MNSGLIPWEPVGRSGRRGGLGAIVLAVACSAASVFGAAVSGADVFGGDVRGTDLASGAGTEAEVDRIIAEADRSLVDALVPAPKRVAAAPGMFRATYRVRVIAETPALARHAAVVAEELHRLTGISAVVGTGGEDDLPVIRLRLTPPAPGQEPILDAAGLPAEGFRLDIGPQEIIAAAATPVGVAWATRSLCRTPKAHWRFPAARSKTPPTPPTGR
ncbi:MAG: glycoside hydrolase family 20 zincin-like fold domain-containing protein [Phycisphaerales bacterium]